MRTRMVGDVAVIMPAGSLSSSQETDDLDQALQKLAAKNARSVVSDCTNVLTMDTSCLGVLNGAHAQITRRGGRIALACLSERLTTTLTTMGLSKVFTIYSTVEQAVTTLTQSQQAT